MKPATSPEPAAPFGVAVGPVMTLQFPDYRDAFAAALARTGDAWKAFCEVQVEFLMNLSPGAGNRPAVEEAVAATFAKLRTYPGCLEDYARGACAGLMQGVHSLLTLLQSPAVVVSGATAPPAPPG
jgi:hypothetical protein